MNFGFGEEWKELKRFKNLTEKQRSIVFYAENKASINHFRTLISELTKEKKLQICYVTSVRNDPILSNDNEKINTINICKRTVLGKLLRSDFESSNIILALSIIQSLNLLSDSINSFVEKCLKGLKPNKKNIRENLLNSLMLVTALNNFIGYDNAAKIAKKAFKENLTLKEAAVKLKLVDIKKFDEIVDPKKMI